MKCISLDVHTTFKKSKLGDNRIFLNSIVCKPEKMELSRKIAQIQWNTIGLMIIMR